MSYLRSRGRTSCTCCRERERQVRMRTWSELNCTQQVGLDSRPFIRLVSAKWRMKPAESIVWMTPMQKMNLYSPVAPRWLPYQSLKIIWNYSPFCCHSHDKITQAFPFPSLLTFLHSPFLSFSSKISSPSLLSFPPFSSHPRPSTVPGSPPLLNKLFYMPSTISPLLTGMRLVLLMPAWNWISGLGAHSHGSRLHYSRLWSIRKQIHFISFKLLQWVRWLGGKKVQLVFL